MGILDYLIPQTMEQQRTLARQRFGAGLAQPQMFDIENAQITPQMVQDYERGYGIPYPTRQMPSPTAGMTGMTFDPNRGAAIQQPQNLPIEYVPPRSAEDIALREAGIQGRAETEKTFSGLQYAGEQRPRLEGFFQDYGEDIEDYDIPGTLGQFQKPGPAEPQKRWGPIQYDKYGHAYTVEETTQEPKSLWGAPSEGADGGKTQEDRDFEQALAIVKEFNERMDPWVAQMIGLMGAKALNNPLVQEKIKGKLNPYEELQYQMALQFIDYHQTRRQKRYGLGPTQPQGEAATADQFLRDEGLR